MCTALQSALLLLAAAGPSAAMAQQSVAESSTASTASTVSTASAPALGEILVQARRDDTGASTVRNPSTTVVNARQLEQNNAIDMANIARYSPLISVPAAASGGANVWDGAGNTGFNIRGVEGNRVSMELDGISLPDAAPRPESTANNSFGIGRDYFDPETFREVRIGAGATQAGPGNPGLGGSVSFLTKAPEDYLDASRGVYVDYKAGYSSEQGARLHALTAATELGANLQGLIVAVHRAGRQADSKGDAPANPDDWSSDAVLAKLSWLIARGHKLGFTVDHYQAQHDRIYANKVGALYPSGATQDSSTERNRYSVEHQYTPSGLALFDRLDSRVYLQKATVEDLTHADYVSGAQPYVRDITTGYYNNSKGLALDAYKQLTPAASLSYGIGYERLESRRPWLEDRTVVRTGVHQITRKNRMADMDTDKLSAYLRGEFGFTVAGHQATLSPGLRGEQRRLTPKNLETYLIAVPSAASEIRKDTSGYLTPSLNLSLALTPELSTYVQYSRGARLPSAAERTGTYDSFSYTGAGNGYAVLGNPKLAKETSNAFEVGLKGAPIPGVELSASLFYNRYNNFIDYVAQPADPLNYPTITAGLFRPENIGKARTWGGEFTSRLVLGQWWPAMKGYSLALAGGLSRGASENSDTGAKGELASVQPYKANAIFAYDDPAKRGGGAFAVSAVRAKQSGADVLTGTSGARFATPGYAVMDLSAYWQVNRHAVLTAGLYNLGDRKYWDYASSHALPAGTSVATVADIERQARPGRNYAVSLRLIY